MKVARRILAIFLSIVATITLVAALIVRVAYAEAFNTDTYVKTVSQVIENSGPQSRVTEFAANQIVKSAHLDDHSFARAFRKAGVQPEVFQDMATRIIENSVTAFLSTPTFKTLWADTNRKAHSELMKIAKGNETVTQDFTIDLGPIVKAAASAIQDPENKISKVIPLKTFVPTKGDFQFKLIQASGVEDLRNAVDIAGKARTGLLFSSLFLLALAWLIFGRTRGAHRLVAISLMSAGILAFVVRATGKVVVGNVAGDEAKDSAKAIYTITTSPLTGYALLVLIIGAAGFAATFYTRNKTN